MLRTNGNGGEKMRDKRRKFVDLAENRVNRAIRDIRLIGNLSNRSAYEYTDDDIKKMFKAIQKEMESAKGRFLDGGSRSENEFKL